MGTETGRSCNKKQTLLGYLQISMAVVRQLHFLFTQQIMQQQSRNTLLQFYVCFVLICLYFYSYFHNLAEML